MKPILLSILLGVIPVGVPLSQAQADAPDAPEVKHHEESSSSERPDKDKPGFHEEIKQQRQEAMDKAARLESEGRKEEAEAVRQHWDKKMEATIEDHHRDMQAKMKEKHQAERRERPERPERPERGQSDSGPGRDEEDAEAPDHRPDGPPRPEVERKLRRVEEAIRHLYVAGLPEPAANLERVAQRLRNAISESKEPRRKVGPRPEGPRRADELAALRREIEELKQAVRKLAEAGASHH